MGNQQITPKQLTSTPRQPHRQPEPSNSHTVTPINQRPTKLPPLNQQTSPPSKLKRSVTSSSVSQFRVTSASKQRLKRKTSNDNLQVTENLEEEDGLSAEDLDNIYFISNAKLDEFYNNLQEPLSKLFTESSKYALTSMTNKVMLNKKQAKLFICEKMLKANLNILKIVGRKTNHEFNQVIFKNFNDLQKSIIGYLKTKYPSGQQNFVSGDLMKVFKSFDYIDSPGNDIVRQAGFYFKQLLTRDLLKKIKEFLNKVIDEVDTNFPRFQKMFQDQIFKASQKSDKSFVYRINRRLPETTSKFTSINSNSLDIDSPQLFRVVLKWVNDMEEFLINTEEEVEQKETFKVINEEDDFKYTVDQITTQEHFSIRQQLKEKLQLERQSYKNQLNDLITSMYRFQHNLIKIVEQGELHERYVPRNDAQIIKFAAYNTKFMSWMLAEKLTIVMKKLIKVGRKFKNTILMVPIDLIKFNVIDLLRASMRGTKAQILQVYSNLKKLESEDQIKIIRMENRLSTTTNDIKINFKLKGCFLICELQLVLSESSHSQNEKLKSMEMFNTFFSELESSPYGVASELAEYVGYKDSKIGYEKKINFVSKDFGIPICELRHPAKISIIKEQFEPFICTTCSRFYGRLENLFIMKNCKECNNFLCSKCMFDKNTTLESTYLKQSIIEYLNNQVTQDAQANRGKGDNSSQNITGNLIYEKSFQKFIFIKDIKKQLKLKKMTITQFQSYIGSLELQRFIYGNYQKGEINLISCLYNAQMKQLSFGMDPTENFYASKKISYRENDFILLYENLTFTSSNTSVLEKKHWINIFDQDTKLKKGIYEAFSIHQTLILISFKSEQIQENPLVKGQEDINIAIQNGTRKEFKFDSIKTYFEYQGVGDSMRKNIKLQDLGLEKRHLSYFSTLTWASQIVQINLSKNKITDINELLKFLPNVQRFIAAQNYIQSLSSPIKLNSLSSLVLKRNLIKEVSKLQNIPNLQKLNLEENRVGVFPTLTLSKLRHFNLSLNSLLMSLDFLQRSTLVELSYLNLEGSLDNIQYPNDDEQHRSIRIPYKKLKCFIISNLKMNKITFASQILQRIELSNSYISQVEGKFTYLEYFIADSSKLKSFNMLFSYSNQNHVIKEIHLQYGQICELPPKINSRSLRKIDLHNNKITDASPLSHYDLPSIQDINISYNEISSIPKLSFRKLVDFSFQGNTLQEIQQFSKSDLPQVKNLLFYADKAVKTWPQFKFPKVIDLSLPCVQFPESFEQFEKSELPSLIKLTVQSSNLQKFPIMNFPTVQNLRILYGTITQLDTLAKCNLESLQIFETNSVNPDYEQISPEKLLKCKIDLPNNLKKLEEITIVSCRFSNLSNLLTKTYNNLQRIYIQYSGLEMIPKLSLPKLKSIFLYSNKINDVSQFFESDLPLLEEIDLSQNKLTSIKKIKFKSLQILNLSRNELKELDGLQLPSLVRIDFSYNQLEQFPVIWAEKLTDIQFSSNPLKSFGQMQKSFLPSLKNLMFQSIQLEDQNVILPKFDMPNIESITLYSVNFIDISNINALNKLTYLDLSYCEKIKIFPKLTLSDLNKLTIYLSTFEVWDGFWESKIDNLQTLSISDTNLQKMGPLKCPNLLELTLYNNQKLIETEVFFMTNKFTQLQTINLSNNKNLKLETELNLPVAKNVTLTAINITSPRLIGQSDRMVSIALRELNFTELDLRQFKKLQNFEASAIQIESIDKFCLIDWKYMKSIVLSDNKIKSIQGLNRFPSLESLYLNCNQIQNPQDLLQKSNLPNLFIMNLEYNKITNIKSIKNMPNLNIIQLDNNQIQDVSFLNRFQNVSPYIGTVSLTNNKIKSIPVLKSAVQFLNFSDNQIESMEFVEKSELPRVDNLMFTNNKIKKLCNVNKLNKLSNLILDSNPIENYDDFFMKFKLPMSFSYLGVAVNASEQKMNEDFEKYRVKYPNISISFQQYHEPNAEIQDQA